MPDPGLEARINDLADRARADRQSIDPPDQPPDEDRAMEFLRNGVGPALAVYIEARTGEWVRFDQEHFDRLERAMNAWLECYAACYGVDLEAEFTLRTAAEALIDTHDIGDVAAVLTKVPARY